LVSKPELKDYRTSVEDHYTVYLPYIDRTKLCHVFSQFPEETFYVYGYNHNGTCENMVFKPTGRDPFLQDMASSKGIISHAGFSITWEAALLRKMIYTIPLARHYEQITNAYRLSQFGLAYASPHLTVKDLRGFISQAESQNYKTPTILPIVSPAALVKAIYREIDDHSPILSCSWVKKHIMNGMEQINSNVVKLKESLSQLRIRCSNWLNNTLSLSTK
jgi:hypothetical protein